METKNAPTKEPLSTLLGGQTIPLIYLDGKFEDVKVIQLPVSSYPEYLKVQDDEPRMAEFLCDKESGWADRLTPACLDAVITLGEELNTDFFSRWVRRRLARQEIFMPGVTKAALEKASESMTTLPR